MPNHRNVDCKILEDSNYFNSTFKLLFKESLSWKALIGLVSSLGGIGTYIYVRYSLAHKSNTTPQSYSGDGDMELVASAPPNPSPVSSRSRIATADELPAGVLCVSS
eukprot:Gregarina_sp_Poly_1__6732@NODE_3623_length_971_cov_167_790929_g513_i3_p2_GENE_NODE_3623_length_971_cov_167_790929_g513_i3NODE_3623_length_971_cov_167_790929_g513_i3_p2_ORF_typecomplete_len107_score13_32_NODE_3623_length_971_cov_167_790929_g513_i3434754